MPRVIAIDDQPISATFFSEGKWLSDFITPEAPNIMELHSKIIENIQDPESRIIALHKWVGEEIKYKKFIGGQLIIEGQRSFQNDLWNEPSITANIKIGNCANKSFLLASLLRQELSADQVYCVLGNLYNGKPGGHAWVQVELNGQPYIVESTRADVETLVPANSTERYESVHFFNDKATWAVEGRTVMEPFTACYSTWLRDYLDWAYIEGRKR